MLSIFFGEREKEIYNPSIYFDHQYEDEWITSDLARQMIREVDRSEVVTSHVIESPVLGGIGPKELSGGVKALMLMAFDESGHVFNASACGDNCAEWILKLAREKDLTITLHHIMKFLHLQEEIRILNTDEVVSNFRDYARIAMQFV